MAVTSTAFVQYSSRVAVSYEVDAIARVTSGVCTSIVAVPQQFDKNCVDGIAVAVWVTLSTKFFSSFLPGIARSLQVVKYLFILCGCQVDVKYFLIVRSKCTGVHFALM